MKKYLLIALALLLAISLIACDGAPETTTDPDTSAPEESTTLPEETTLTPDETTEPESSETTVTPDEPVTPDVPTDPTAFAEVKETVYVYNTDVLNVRESYSKDSTKVGEMKEGESVIRTGYNAEWSRILYFGEVRYASSTYLTTTAPFEYTAKTETVYVNVPQLNLRAKASASNEVSIVATLVYGDAIERTGVSTTRDEDGNEWSRLLYNGQVCYANSTYLSTTKTVSDTLTFEETNDTVYTIAENAVNLREDATVNSTIIASLGYGTKLERTAIATAEDEEGILWSRVTVGDKTGYVSSSFLSTTPVVSFTDADETLYVTADSLNMRSIPAYESSVLRSLPKGTEVHCTGKATAADGDGITWYRIEIDGTIGYASGRYLAAEQPE